MNFSPTQDPYPDENFLDEPSRFATDGYVRSGVSRKDMLSAEGHLFPIDESEEFHDPFSELSLYLSRKIKRELLREKNPRKWSQKIQSLLLQSLLPEFSKKFPKYRLGNTALKKTWDKVLYHLQIIQQEKNAIRPDGKLNIDHFIKQNLKRFAQNQVHTHLHPYNAAHSLAVKISECIAAIDGERPKLDELTQMIWSVQKHLIPKEDIKGNPVFERVDALDKLIIRFQLEITANSPYLTAEELYKRVRSKVKNVKHLQRVKSVDELTSFLSITLARQMTGTLKIGLALSPSEMQLIIAFIQKQMKLFEERFGLFEENDRKQFVKRTLFLYNLASKLPPEEAEKNLKAAFEYVYHLSQDRISIGTPVLKEEVFQFIDAEISLLKARKSSNALDELLSTLLELFNEATYLPKLSDLQLQELEILTWNELEKKESFLEKIPTSIKEIALEELANVHIDHPSDSFEQIICAVLCYFKKIREVDLSELDKKLKLWICQNDMIYASLSFDEKTPILTTIRRFLDPLEDLEKIVSASLNFHIKTNESLAPWQKALKTRMIVMYKYMWYNELRKERETCFDRFTKWHYKALKQKEEQFFSEILFTHLEHIVETLVPLFPFNREQCRALFER